MGLMVLMDVSLLPTRFCGHLQSSSYISGSEEEDHATSAMSPPKAESEVKPGPNPKYFNGWRFPLLAF